MIYFKKNFVEDLKAVSEKKDALFCAKARELGVPIIPGLGEALAMAKKHGVRCITVTNAPRGAGAPFLLLSEAVASPTFCCSPAWGLANSSGRPGI